jgi:hypothetical protein
MPREASARDLSRLRELAQDVRPVAFAHERTLPVLPALEPLFPGRALRRGTSVRVEGVSGATTLALAVLAGPSRAGSWVGCLGVPALGWSAAAEAGVVLDRVVVVRAGEGDWVTAAAALVDAVDVVLLGPGRRAGSTEIRRLAARARERGTVLLGAEAADRPRQDWPRVDVRLSVRAAEWSGPGRGWGHLRARRVAVDVEGRSVPGGVKRVELWLPGPDGIRPVTSGADAPVVALRRQLG